MTSQDPMFSAEDTPANHSAKPAKGKAKKTRDTSSPGSPKPFASYDPDTQSWKTYPDTSLLDSEPYKASWPRSGMTVDGTAYQLPPSAPRTSATEFSLSLHRGPNSIGLWPTATTQDHATRYSQGGMPLGMAARLWPTPRATETSQLHGKFPNPTLLDVARLFPTPTATANINAPNERKKWPWLFPTPVATGVGGSGAMENLKKRKAEGQITDEEYKGMIAGNGGRLNPTWVEWLMGFPTGWTDLEDSETQSSHKWPNTSEES